MVCHTLFNVLSCLIFQVTGGPLLKLRLELDIELSHFVFEIFVLVVLSLVSQSVLFILLFNFVVSNSIQVLILLASLASCYFSFNYTVLILSLNLLSCCCLFRWFWDILCRFSRERYCICDLWDTVSKIV